MPLPKPGKKEDKSEYLERCMGDDTMREEFGNVKQRYAVCNSQWSNKDKKINASLEERVIIYQDGTIKR